MLRMPVGFGSRGRRPQRMTAARKISSAADVTDEALIWMCAALMMFGLVMVYSASIAFPESPKYSGYTSTHFLIRHAISMVVALGAGVFCFFVPLKQWQRISPWLFLFGVFLLAIVLIPMIGKEVYGARRWIPLKVFNLQPSELMKVFVILYAADYTVRKQDTIQQLKKGVLPLGCAVVLVGVLLLLETDLGAFVVISTIAAGMLFLGGISRRLFAAVTLLSVMSFALVIALSPIRRARIFAYMDPFHPDFVAGKGYQLSQSLIAFGRGEVFGVGLGASVEKLHYLPEPHTDFLLAVIGEELGLVAVLVVIMIFLWIVYRIFEIGRQAIALDQTFGGLVAYGIALWFGIQAFINMGVNLGVLPTKGLTLPLMSYGGSALLANCIALALVLRIDYESRLLMRGGR